MARTLTGTRTALLVWLILVAAPVSALEVRLGIGAFEGLPRGLAVTLSGAWAPGEEVSLAPVVRSRIHLTPLLSFGPLVALDVAGGIQIPTSDVAVVRFLVGPALWMQCLHGDACGGASLGAAVEFVRYIELVPNVTFLILGDLTVQAGVGDYPLIFPTLAFGFSF